MIHIFSQGDVHRPIAASLFPDAGPEVRHKSLVEPCSLLAAFPSLRLRSGYTLRAFSFCEGGNGNAFVYATPMDAPTARATPAASLSRPSRPAHSPT